MKAIACKEATGIECPWETKGEPDNAVLQELAQHAIDVHKVWPEDGPVPTWVRLRHMLRDVEDSAPSS
jgi:predicted small metal-binding protein